MYTWSGRAAEGAGGGEEQGMQRRPAGQMREGTSAVPSASAGEGGSTQVVLALEADK